MKKNKKSIKKKKKIVKKVLKKKKAIKKDLKKKKEDEKANAVTHAIPNSSTSKMNSETTDKVK